VPELEGAEDINLGEWVLKTPTDAPTA